MNRREFLVATGASAVSPATVKPLVPYISAEEVYFVPDRPDRIVVHGPVGLVLYEKRDNFWRWRGPANPSGAVQWLDGLPLEQVEHYKVAAEG